MFKFQKKRKLAVTAFFDTSLEMMEHTTLRLDSVLTAAAHFIRWNEVINWVLEVEGNVFQQR
jgi:hypothetical protein